MTKIEFKGLDFEYLHKNGDELIKCNDYIPLHLSPYYDNIKRTEYLKQNKIYDKIYDIEKQKREEFIRTRDKIQWNINDIIEFIEKYNEYNKILL